jgi:hypothetical protein
MRRRPRGRRRSVDRGTRGPAMELRNQALRGADAVNRGGRPHRGRRHGQAVFGPRAVEDPAHAWKLSARETGDPSGTHRASLDGSAGKGQGRTSGVHAWGKSDDRVLPEKPPNKGEHVSPAEAVEGRRSTKGSMMAEAASRTQSRINAPLSGHRARCPGSPCHRHDPR